MADIERARKQVVARILEGDGDAPRQERRAAFDNAPLGGPLGTLVQKVAERAHEISDADVAAVRAAGASEDRIFELVVCAAIGQATRQYEAALAALARATGEG
jgi:hypothetical protein